MSMSERELDMALAEAEQENRLLRARNERLERELAGAVATEREAHAELVETMGMQGYGTLAIAAAIRARGKT